MSEIISEEFEIWYYDGDESGLQEDCFPSVEDAKERLQEIIKTEQYSATYKIIKVTHEVVE